MSNPRFPLYVPSKGRSKTRLTIRELERLNVPFHVIVEEQQYNDYAAVVDPRNILVLDKKYQRDSETLDNFGETKSKGAGPARNFAWDHSIANGHAWHWVMDDNIRKFSRLNRNNKTHFGDGSVFFVMEEFCLRYKNIAMAGPNYDMFVPRKYKRAPFFTNTRIYSCNLIRNDVPYRWRMRMNEDTDLSLQMLKGGWCTILFNAFVQDKMTTQVVSGGNTTEFYADEGTLWKSQMLVDAHPDVTTLM